MSHRLHLVIPFTLFAASSALFCGQDSSPAVEHPVHPADTVATPAKDNQPTTVDLKAQELWLKVRDRQKCNLLNGCDVVEQLVALSPDIAANAALKVLKAGKNQHWRISLLRAMRTVRDDRIRTIQWKLLEAKVWPIRAYAAVGLGFNRHPDFVQHSARLIEQEPHPGARIGWLWGMLLARKKDARKQLIAHIRSISDSRDIRIHLIAMDAIREARLVELLPTVHAWLGHWNLFVAREAVRTVDSLLDRTSIPRLISLLDHPSPPVKKESLSVLRKLTGLRHRTSQASFESWCAKFCKDHWPKPGDKQR